VDELGRFEQLVPDEPYPGLERRTFDAAGATVNEYRFRPGARFPVHSHPQEQITLVEEGEIELTVREEVTRLEAGAWSVVGGDVPHGIRAGEHGARIVAIVVPRRSSADAYTVLE
jgi:quercetin dioxygenase-like cupin family protein